MSFESGFKCKLSDGFVALLEIPGGALQPQPPDVLLQRFADEAPKNTRKVELRKGRHGGDPVQFQFIVQMPLDEHQRADDPLVVILLGGCLHRRTSKPRV